MILRAHIQYIHIHAYRYYAGRPRDPTSVPKAVLGPSFSPDGGTVRECAVCRGQWMGIGVAITSFDLYHGVQSMFSGCPGCKDRVFILTSLAKYEF